MIYDLGRDLHGAWLHIGVLGVILLLAFVIRVVPRLWLPNAICSDSYFHLSIARFIRENGHRFIKTMPRNLWQCRFTYPCFYHWLLSFFSEVGTERVERYSSAIADLLHTFWTFWFAKEVFDASGLAVESTLLALWSAALFTLSPALLSVGGGPRAYHGSPRSVAQFLFSIFMGGAILYSLNGENVYIVISVIAVVPLAVTSKFANQALLFFSVLLALFGDFLPLQLAAAGYAASFLVTRGHTWHVLVGQFRHSSFYFRRLQRRYLYPVQRTPVKYLRGLRAALRSPLALMNWYFTERYWVHLLVTVFPQLVVAPAILLLMPWTGTLQGSVGETVSQLAKWIVPGLICMTLTAHRPFLFLGEPERYTEMTVMPQIVLFTLISYSAGVQWLLLVLLVYSALTYVPYVAIFNRTFSHWKIVYDRLLPLIRALDEPDTLFYPLGTCFWPLVYALREARYLSPTGNIHESYIPWAEWDTAFGQYPFPNARLEEVAARFGVDYVIAGEQDIASYEELMEDPSFTESRLAPVKRSEPFGVYEVGKGRPVG